MTENEILSIISETNVYQKIKELKRIYQELEERQKVFCSTFDVHCLDGCGNCCLVFTPDIKMVEAYFIAYGLIINGKDKEVLELLTNYAKDKKTCPLYLYNNKYHCSIYDYRPLVCRLFGSSITKDKDNNPAYRNCKWKDDSSLTKEELNLKKEALVFMSDYGQRLQEIDPQDTKTEILEVALTKAINVLNYILELEKNTN